MTMNRGGSHILNRTTYDDLYSKRNKLATVDDQFIAVVRNAQEANELVRMQKAQEMTGSHSWSTTYNYNEG